MMVAMAAHSEEQAQSIYHVTLSLRNPAPYAVLADSGHRYFLHNPPHSKENGEPVQLSRTRFFRTLPRFRKTERTKKTEREGAIGRILGGTMVCLFLGTREGNLSIVRRLGISIGNY